MPTKRRAVAVDSDAEDAGSQASKRARTAGGSDVEDPPRAGGSGTRGAQTSGNEPINVDDLDEDMAQEAPDEDDEKRFEEEHEEAIRKKVIGGPKASGVSGGGRRSLEVHKN